MSIAIATLVLAAGASKRLGQSKQLLQLGDRSLLQHSVEVALQASGSPVVVVLGAQADRHRRAIQNLPVNIIIHPGWEKGMGSSLKAGVSFILESHPKTQAMLIMVCDQPLVTPQHLQRMTEAYRKGYGLVASGYQDTVGVPVLFDMHYRDALLNLPDDAGAKKMLNTYRDLVHVIALPGGELDIDTPGDYEKLRGSLPDQQTSG